MCLLLVKDEPKIDFKQGEAIAYKLFLVDGWDLFSAFLGYPVIFSEYSDRDGYKVQSGRLSPKLDEAERQNKLVEIGIHALLDKEDADMVVGLMDVVHQKHLKVLPVKVLKKDLVATGLWDGTNSKCAVFTNVYIS